MKSSLSIFWLMLFLMLMNCKSKYILEKSTQCSDLKKQAFSSSEVVKIEGVLDSMIYLANYKLKNKKTHLEVKTKAKTFRSAQELENAINKPIIVFKQLEEIKNIEESKTLKVLRNIQEFRSIGPQEELWCKSNVLGYVENEGELIAVNRQLKRQNCSLSSENLHWTSNPQIVKKKKSSRYYLLATNNIGEVNLENISDIVVEIKALIDYENFEPSIRIFLNECGLNKYGNHLGPNDFTIYAALIDGEIISIQRIRLRENNRISIFGFKSLEEAAAVVKRAKKENMFIKIK